MEEQIENSTESTELKVSTPGGTTRQSLTITGPMRNLHDSPEKVRQLLDLLELPEGTQVEISTRASSVIVR